MTEELDTIEDEAGLRRVMQQARTVAVIGMKPRGEEAGQLDSRG